MQKQQQLSQKYQQSIKLNPPKKQKTKIGHTFKNQNSINKKCIQKGNDIFKKHALKVKQQQQLKQKGGFITQLY